MSDNDQILFPDLSNLNSKSSVSKNSNKPVENISDSFPINIKKNSNLDSVWKQNKLIEHNNQNPVCISTFLNKEVKVEESSKEENLFSNFLANDEHSDSLLEIRNKNKNKISVQLLKNKITIKRKKNFAEKIYEVLKKV